MNRLFLTASALLLAMTAMAANEDSTPIAANDTSRVVDLDEVIIVSQPKETLRLRRQAASSSVFSSSELQRLNVEQLSQLANYVPSFAMPAYGARLTSSMYIRGLGSRISNSAVGLYYDNIPLMTPAAYNSHFYLIDRVDVLRGPQGTLYGANTEGGIVRIYSKNPMNYAGTDVNMGLASAFGRHIEVAHYHHPTDGLAFSAAAFYSGQDGFFRNLNLNEQADQTTEAGGRLRMMWKPTGDRLLIDLTTDYQYTRQNGFPYGNYSVEDHWASLPSTTFMPGYKRNMVNTGLNISLDMGQLLLTSTTSHQFLRDRMDMDIDYTPADRMQLMQRQKMNAVTEELTLRSKGYGAWRHTTGIFASQQWLHTDADVVFGQDMMRPIGMAIENAMKQAMAQAFVGRFMAQGMTPEQAMAAAMQQVEAMGVTMQAEMAVPNVYRQPQTTMAVYHESNITLADLLTATIGLRLDYGKAKIDYDSYGYMAMTGGTASAIATNTLSSHLKNQHNTSYTQLLPKFGLSYRLDGQGSNLYATVAKGYMAGGYNIQMFSDIQQSALANPEAQQQAQRGDVAIEHGQQDYEDIEKAITYKPEESWNYELGAHLNLFDGKVQADMAAYYMQLRNQQLSVMAPDFGFGRMTVNAGKSNTWGAEVALRGLALDNRLTWTATYSFTHATFREYSETEADGTVLDYKDNHIPFVPEHAFSASADYRIGVAGDAVLRAVTIGANVTGSGRVYWDDANTASQDLYAVLGAHACLDMGSVNVDFWGRNLTDTRYCTFAMPFSNAYIGQRGTPLQLGVDVRMHF